MTRHSKPRRGGERDSIISGIGQSQVGRRLGRTAMSLTVDACLDAVADAGLTMSDIDGLASYPGGAMDGLTPGFSGPGHRRSARCPAPRSQLAQRRA